MRKGIMNKAERIRGQMADLRAELDEIEQAQKIEDNAKHVGKCYAYRNSYSCPEPDDYWTHYTLVTNVNDEGRMQGISFQTDKYGKIEFEPRPYIAECTLQREIQRGEYEDAFDDALRAVYALRELPKGVSNES